MHKKPKTKHFAYLILMYDERGKIKYTKVGYTNNLEKRRDELEYKYECRVEIINFWWFNEKETALDMENAMRLHFKRKKGSHYIPQDRFQRVKIETSDLDYFNREALFLANRYESN